MSRDKQIEEMANIIHDADAKIIYNMVKAQPEDFVGRALPRQVYVAKELYAMGYRKAEDVAREIFAEIEQHLEMQIKALDMFKNDEDDFYNGEQHALCVLQNYLKKKYESEGADDE